MPNATLTSVNKELEAQGFPDRLYRGEGYFYFSGGQSDVWCDRSVFVASVKQLSVSRWVEEFKFLKEKSGTV